MYFGIHKTEFKNMIDSVKKANMVVLASMNMKINLKISTHDTNLSSKIFET